MNILLTISGNGNLVSPITLPIRINFPEIRDGRRTEKAGWNCGVSLPCLSNRGARFTQRRRLNIVFDLGGVIVTWQPDVIAAKVFADPGVQDVVRTGIFGHTDWVELDRGTLPRQDAIVRAAKRTGLDEAAIGELLRQVPLALVAIPRTIDLLYQLRARGHALFCPSNMHIASIDHLERKYSFWEVFEGTVISCRVQLCKPEPAIYAHLVETYRLKGTETVFVDDTEVNLTVAEQFGVRTIKFENPMQCECRLRTFGCI